MSWMQIRISLFVPFGQRWRPVKVHCSSARWVSSDCKIDERAPRFQTAQATVVLYQLYNLSEQAEILFWNCLQVRDKLLALIWALPWPARSINCAAQRHVVVALVSEFHLRQTRSWTGIAVAPFFVAAPPPLPCLCSGARPPGIPVREFPGIGISPNSRREFPGILHD